MGSFFKSKHFIYAALFLAVVFIVLVSQDNWLRDKLGLSPKIESGNTNAGSSTTTTTSTTPQTTTTTSQSLYRRYGNLTPLRAII